MTTYRQAHREMSNNSDNPNQNVCAMMVAKACGVADNVRYLHTFSDLKRAMQTKWSFRSRKSSFKAKTVSQFSKAIKATNPPNRPQHGEPKGYVVMVKGHVLLMNHKGDVIVDTSSQGRPQGSLTVLWGHVQVPRHRHLGAPLNPPPFDNGGERPIGHDRAISD